MDRFGGLFGLKSRMWRQYGTVFGVIQHSSLMLLMAVCCGLSVGVEGSVEGSTEGVQVADSSKPGMAGSSSGQKGVSNDVLISGVPDAPGLPGLPGPKGEPGEVSPQDVLHFLGSNAARDLWSEGVLQGPPGLIGAPGAPGPPGARGLRGHPGLPGVPGRSLLAGAKGEKGEIGLSGPNGNTGDRGPMGSMGAPGQGLKGSKGDRGVPEVGKPGPPGPPGPQGPPGPPAETPWRWADMEGLQQNTAALENTLDYLLYKGSRGDPGLPGLLGDKGSKGEPGVPGIQGGQGIKGDRGPPGFDGLPGAEGGRGYMGPMGVPGTIGPAGEAGQKGDQGNPGGPGEKGVKGDGAGAPGMKGQKGDIGLGFPGKKGLNGLPGMQGEKGVTGEVGERGKAGATGKKGDSGSPGTKGETGPPGGMQISSKGIKGDNGSPGLKGDIGPEGPIGAPGLAGEDGSTGLKGESGETVIGQKGAQGDVGAPGVPGAAGRKGNPGDRGPSGQQGVPGTKGETGECVKGDKGDSGSTSIPPNMANILLSGQSENAHSATMSVYAVHSQSATVPNCPDARGALWEGYSLLHTQDEGRSQVQDLGSSGSCLRHFNPMPFLFCNIYDVCNYGYRTTSSYWLTSGEPPARTPLSGQSIQPHISRCRVCQSRGPLLTLHSQTSQTPECPHGWRPLWQGYSFIMHSVGSMGGGQQLSSPGSCLRYFRSRLYLECDSRGRCHVYSNKYAYWLVGLQQGAHFSPGVEGRTLTTSDLNDQLSRCVVCAPDTQGRQSDTQTVS